MTYSQPAIWLRQISPSLRLPDREDAVRSHTSMGKCPAHFSTPSRIIYDHELIMYRDCTCSIEFEDAEFICKPDTFIIIPPGKWHSELCLESHGGCRYWCHFDWQFQSVRSDSPVMTFATHRPHYELCRPAPDFIPFEIQFGKIADGARAYELGEKLQALSSGGTTHEMLLAGTVLHELLVELLDAALSARQPLPTDESKEAPLASRIRRALDMIAFKPHKNLKMSRSLSRLGYSYEHVCRVFKKTYGVSPLQYVHAQQMTRAKALLKKSELTVAEICFAIGMNSPAYFTKTFHGLIGKTPSEYRKGFEL